MASSSGQSQGPTSGKVTFAAGTTSVEIPGPVADQPITPTPQWVTDLAADGTRYAYKATSSQKRVWRLSFRHLSSQDHQDLQNFYDNAVGGLRDPFTYTHTDGTAYQARFVQPALPWRRIGPNQFALELELEIDGLIQ